MKTLIASSAALLATTAIVNAGGIERSAQSMAILFEEGTYAELGFSIVDPDVTGSFSLGGAPSGDVAPRYTTIALSYRQDLTDQLSFAFVLDEHIGASVDYPVGTGYPAAGATATVDGQAFTALLRYELPSNVSVYGGIRVSQAEGVVSLPFVGGYTMTADGGTELGYVLGAAYERPDIALRVALTYSSAIDHTFSGQERGAPMSFETTIPQSVNLEFQSGIAADTLLFGSVRWVDWSEFDITPPGYALVPGGSLVNYTDDTVTYTLGVGRRFTDAWSGAVSFVFEPDGGTRSGNLGPTDGRMGVGVGATWNNGQGFEVSGGVQYSMLGDTVTNLGPGNGIFTDNTSLAAGLRFGYNF